jgi:hypothetical protein
LPTLPPRGNTNNQLKDLGQKKKKKTKKKKKKKKPFSIVRR